MTKSDYSRQVTSSLELKELNRIAKQDSSRWAELLPNADQIADALNVGKTWHKGNGNNELYIILKPECTLLNIT